ncbi:MAG: nuclear transport factor 2 family protein [Acidobacteriota bacterium]
MPDTQQAFETITASDIVNRYFAAYETQDRAVIDELLSETFTFTGPNDDHIDKALYFEKCWQFSNNSPTYRFEKLVASPDGDVFVLYECTVHLETFRNTEFFRISNNQIKAIEVFFGSLPENGTKKKEISFYDTMISVKR